MDATPHPYPWAVRGFSLASARQTVSSESNPRGTPKANANLLTTRYTPHGFLCNSRYGRLRPTHPAPLYLRDERDFYVYPHHLGKRGRKGGNVQNPSKGRRVRRNPQKHTQNDIYTFLPKIWNFLSTSIFPFLFVYLYQKEIKEREIGS